MRYLALYTLVLFTFAIQPAHSRPDPAETGPQPHDRAAPMVRLPASSAKSLVDSLYIIGGPDRWDGSFETPAGQADWHGWSHEDLTIIGENNHWHVSTYWAENLGGLGNHALYCGDETIPACTPSDTIGGVGPGFLDDIEWRHSVADNTQPVTVRLAGLMNFDLPDTDWDFLELIIRRGDQTDVLATWTGPGQSQVNLDFTTVVSPGEFTGPDNNEVCLVWRVWTSDDGWDDADCFNPSHGACQIDNIAVILDGALATFDDFESGNSVNWIPAAPRGVGDFANLRNDLGDIDPCRDNNTWQVNFVDNGLVVPGTGGTPCIEFCYDPGNWIVNNTGGLLADDPQTWFLDNQVLSPPIPWVPGNDGGELSFDVYRHELFNTNGSNDNAGIFYQWFVRSTASTDPADLENALWRARGVLYHGGPEYIREIQPVSDLMEPDRQWVQIALGATEKGWQWGINGNNGTPAPYFDNVAFKIWDPDGPEILVKGSDLFADAFPETGTLNQADLAANWCRIDIQETDFMDGRYVQGDSLQAQIVPIRHGATVPEPASLHWVMSCNPTFDTVRPQAPDGQGLLRGMASGSIVLDHWGTPRVNTWSFDLPDTGFFFPGDRLHYYLTASDDLAGDVRTSVWPPDTTGVLDFTLDSPYPGETTARALPTITQPVAGEFSQPSLLFCDGTEDRVAAAAWFDALQELGYRPEIEYDVITVHKGKALTGLGALATVNLLAGYPTFFFSSGAQSNISLSGAEWSNDAKLVSDWLATGEKRALLAGDYLLTGLDDSIDGQTLMSQLGVAYLGPDVGAGNGGERDLQTSSVVGNRVVPDDIQWQVYAGCPEIRYFDAISAVGDGQVSATLDPQGMTGGPYAALVTVDDQTLVNRTAVMPFDLEAVTGLTVVPGMDHDVFSAQAHLVNFLLFWLGADAATSADDIPGIGQVSVAAHPNPFNPVTTISFDLPRALEVSLEIYDLQGRLVRTLLNGNLYPTGSHKQVWDGRDGKGQAAASGVYFYRLTAGDQNRVGKLTLLK
jgi:hypothetical protein